MGIWFKKLNLSLILTGVDNKYLGEWALTKMAFADLQFILAVKVFQAS